MNSIVRLVLNLRSRPHGFAAVAFAWVLTVGLWPLWLGIWFEDDPRWQSRIRHHLREDLQPVLDWLFNAHEDRPCRPLKPAAIAPRSPASSRSCSS